MESVDSKEEIKNSESKFKQEIFSKVVRAGKRTYFFDVKATRADEYYLTITESKKKYSENGKFFYEKHKVFLYKEDFEKFVENLQEVIDFIHEKQPVDTLNENVEVEEKKPEKNEETVKNYTNVDFEDI